MQLEHIVGEGSFGDINQGKIQSPSVEVMGPKLPSLQKVHPELLFKAAILSYSLRKGPQLSSLLEELTCRISLGAR